MREWLRSVLRLRKAEEDKATEQAVEVRKQRQKMQFDAWADTMQEVERVQTIASGQKR